MKKLLTHTAAVLFVSAFTASAQMEMPGSPAGINASLSKLFGDVKSFSAKSEVRVFDKAQKEKLSSPMDFAMLDGKMRVEVDISQVKNKDMTAAGAASMKQFGMDRVISIVRPDKKSSYIVFPGMQSYVNAPMSQDDLEIYEKNPKIEKTAIGKETLDGHPCVKNKVVLTDDKGRKNEATIWNATDLKDFPLQIQTREKDDSVVLRFRQVQLTKPDAKQFETPAGFTSYEDMPSLMQGVMMKVMSNAAPPKK